MLWMWKYMVWSFFLGLWEKKSREMGERNIRINHRGWVFWKRKVGIEKSITYSKNIPKWNLGKVKWFWKNNSALSFLDTLPSTVPIHEKHHVSLISTWILSCWPQLWVWPCQFFICWVIWLSNPCLSNLETRVSTGIVSEALHKSREMMPVALLLEHICLSWVNYLPNG